MPLPTVERVVYPHNTLASVGAQVHFPVILRIDSQPPVEFQELVRADYPLLTLPEAPPLPVNMPPQVQQILRSTIAAHAGKTYVFDSPDNFWKVTLSKEYLSLVCLKYESWELFKARFLDVFQSLIKVYAPSFYSRVGLRYTNIIFRSQFGLAEVKWNELLKPHIAAERAAESIEEDEIETEAHYFTMVLPDSLGKVRVQHGAGIARSEPLGATPTAPEQVYLIDNDFFSERKADANDVRTRIDRFHDESYKLFRWCITDRLERAMAFEPVE